MPDKEEVKCVFWRTGNLCGSDYGKSIKCDGVDAPKNCPYEVVVNQA